MAWVVTAVVAAVEVGATAAVIFTAVAEVGIALQVVGTVTKSKELVKIGGIMGAVGAVGGLASAGFSALSAGAGEAGVAEGATAGAYSDVAGEQFAQQAGTDAAGSGFGDMAASAATAPAVVSPVDSGGLTSSGMTQVPGGGTPPAGAPAPSAVTAAPAGTMPPPQSAESMFNTNVAAGTPPIAAGTAPQAAFNLDTMNSVVAPSDTSSFGISKWFDSLDKATQGRVVSGAMQIGGAAVGGLFNGWSEDQKLALERERQALQQKAYATSMANASAQPKVAAYVKPTGMMTQ